jgi:hypothetical protein
VAVLVERAIGSADAGETLPVPVVVRRANEKTPSEIHEEIRRAQTAPLPEGDVSLERAGPLWLQSFFFRLPAAVRDLIFWRWFLRDPLRIKRTMGTVVVTATGMAAPGVLAWGIPLSLHPLAIGVGGIVRRGSGAEQKETLALTIVFDHVVTDGAPVGRFIRRLHPSIARAEGLSGSDPAGHETEPHEVGAAPGGG